MNEPPVEPPPDEPPDETPDDPPDEPPGINLMLCFDPNSNVANFSFYLDTNTYLTTNLDNLGSGDTYENLDNFGSGDTYQNLENDPGNGLGITAPFQPNAGPGAERDVGVTVSGISDERGTGSIDLEVDENPDIANYDNPSIDNVIDCTTNYCGVTSLGNDYSQASITGHIQTTFS